MISQLRQKLIQAPQERPFHARRVPHLDAMAPTAEGLEKCTLLTRLLQVRADGLAGALTAAQLCQEIAGLDPTVCDGHGVSPLNAALLHRQTLPVLEALIKAGADVNAADDNGVFPLEVAMTRGEPKVMDLLRKARVDGDRRFDHNRTYAHLAIQRSVPLTGLKKVKTDLDAADDHGWRPVHYAALANAYLTKDLVRARVAVDEVTPAGDTALALAAKNALSLRIRHWSSEGQIADNAAAYTIEDGVMVFRMNGKQRKISPKDERIMARRLGVEAHAEYLNAVDTTLSLAKAATLSLNSADGTPIVQLLADLQRPELSTLVGKRGVDLPLPRKFRRVEKPKAP